MNRDADAEFISSSRKRAAGVGQRSRAVGDGALEALLSHLYRNRGFDFHGYKRATLLRRIQRRMQVIGVSDFERYLDHLEVDPGEFGHLFNTILINVTSFFRDEAVWEQLRRLFRARAQAPGGDSVVRAWCAGCASGEEAYSLAMLVAEERGMEALGRTVKIYATDIDEEALDQARLGAYTARQVASVPGPLRKKYFNRVGANFILRSELRRGVIFGRHNLLQDAPISRLDVLTCRNTLMYFHREAQSKILHRFHFALREEGLLVLGKAEVMLSHEQMFSPVDLKRRIFIKGRPRELAGRPLGAGFAPELALDPSAPGRQGQAVANAEVVAQVVLDEQGEVLLINERARLLLGADHDEISRSLRELQLSQQLPGGREQLPMVIPGVEWQVGGATQSFDVQLVSLFKPDGQRLGLQLNFVDLSPQRRLQRELQHVSRELSVAHEELETTNEELQSTVEELETMNEELQSTNGELETMNEELQSMNEELRQRGDELNLANSFLNAILRGLHAGVVVLDGDQLIRVWNHRSEDLWGVRQDEVRGKHFCSLEIGLPVGELAGELRACHEGDHSPQGRVFSAIDRRGKTIRCKVTCKALPFEGSPRGTILLVEDITQRDLK